ncbi:MAG TPA: bifunctional 5,10-methylenetetrahydrofolate dehydrogenase/5,10-methenyltetrahydrofolate cyclohydrolase [Candidatus Saccharimonadales bacterium]|nr:bifunctional 5,10-methylenetetrahydrofolate dehydrogenase/5,10-methenyltetrahydrofolate cyclohydrolase [Candidatus Saccharimonadales bacterium]
MRVDGKEIAEKIYKELEDRVGDLKKKNIVPHLVVILVGKNPASVAYVTLKQRKGEEIGAKITVLKYNTDITTYELIEKIKLLNIDPFVHGILIQRPLPEQIDVDKLEQLTNPEKDVDGFNPDSPYTLPLPLAVIKILEEIYKIKARDTLDTRDTFISWLKNQEIVVLGKGPTGGGPILKLLNKLGTNPMLIDSKTENPQELKKKADIIIASVGRENVVKPEDIKNGAILIGVGLLRGEDGKLKGDYEPEKIKDIAGYYTPTPGGVGPVNVAMLIENLVTAAEKQTSLTK